MKIIDCFIFYNELDLVNYRLNILNNYVDYFVIVESTHTFCGNEKKLYFNDNKHLFEKFLNKIIHIVVDDMPYKYPNINIKNNDQWKNEEYQRNAISRGINMIDNLTESDIIIISDADEIPDPDTLNKIKTGIINVNVNTLVMDLYYYNLNTKCKDNWFSCKIILYKNISNWKNSCNDIRHISKNESPCILNGGWHMSYFGNIQFIKNKINQFSHQEYNNEKYTNLIQIEENISKNKDLYGRNVPFEKINIKDNEYLPKDYSIYLYNYFT